MKKLLLLTFLVSISILLSEQLIVKKIAHGYKKPVYLTAAKNVSDTLYVVEQGGKIQTIIKGRTIAPLLDIRERVHQPKMPGDERGLLGMALHPDFRNNGKFYVNYVNRDDTTIISTYTLKDGHLTASGEEVIMRIKQPYSNHNGGQLAFGPDGYLYIGLGDGGYAGDPKSNGQNTHTLLGTIMRLADWYGIKQIVASEDCADPYSPKTISATMGSFARVTVTQLNLPDYLKHAHLPIYGAFLDGDNVHNVSFSAQGILLMGSESRGIREQTSQYVTNKITIPSFGGAESLNVAMAAGIIIDNIRRHHG